MQVDALLKVLANAKPSFLLCLLPHPLAGLCELFRRSPGRALNQRLLREQVGGEGGTSHESQVWGMQLLEYLLLLRELARLEQVMTRSQAALHDLATCHSSSLAQTQPPPSASLARELWGGLQVEGAVPTPAALPPDSHTDGCG